MRAGRTQKKESEYRKRVFRFPMLDPAPAKAFAETSSRLPDLSFPQKQESRSFPRVYDTLDRQILTTIGVRTITHSLSS
jgi:hypothetical protein